MRMSDLIVKKRDGQALTTEEIRYMIDGYSRGEIPDYQMSAMTMAIYFRGMDRRETLDLTMAMMHSGETLALAEDSSASQGSGGDVRQERQVLTVNRGSGRQEVVVTRRMYPVYQGAVVVCQGAGDSRVRLTVVDAVSVLTGLSSDKISVVKWKN